MNPTWLYVAALYAAAVTLARRSGVELPKRVALLFYLLVLGFLFEPLVGRYVNIHVDVLRNIPPWHEVTRDRSVGNQELNDVPLQIVPWAHQAREAWKSGHLPLWNPNNASGYPLLANAQSAALSPLRILALPLPLGRAMTAEAAMKLLVALTFAYLWCRRRSSQFASIAGAITFGFGGFLCVWLHFPLATAGAFLPAVLYQIDLLAERITWRRFVFFSAIWTAMVFSGHPETAAHIFLLAVAYVVWLVAVERRAGRRFVATLFAALCLSGLFCAPYLAPLLEAIPESQRFATLRAESSLPRETPYANWATAVMLLQPLIFGDVPLRPAWAPSHTDPLGGYAGVFGAVAFVAVLFSVVKARAWRSREAFCLLMAVAVFAVVLDWPGVSDLFHRLLPIAANSRLRLLFVLLLATLVAAAIDGGRKPIAIGIGVVAVTIAALLIGIPFPSKAWFHTGLRGAVPGLIVLVAAAFPMECGGKAAALARSLVRRKRTSQSGDSVAALQINVPLLAAIVFDLWGLGREWNPPLREDLLYPRTLLITRLVELHEELPKHQTARMVAQASLLFPNTSAIFGLEDIRTHDPMTPARYLAFLRAADDDFDPGAYFAMWHSADAAVLDFLNVRFVVTDPRWELNDPRRFVERYRGVDGRIYENLAALPRFFAVRNVVSVDRAAMAERVRQLRDWKNTALVVTREAIPAAKADVAMIEATPARYTLEVRAEGEAFVASSIPWNRGWVIEREGVAIEPVRIHGAFIGFRVPAGVTRITVAYRPLTFRLGFLAALLGLAGSTVGRFAWMRYRRAA